MKYAGQWLELIRNNKDIIKDNFQLLRENKCNDWLDVNRHGSYILLEGFGSLFDGSRNLGYFCRGSLISFIDLSDCEFVNARVEGQQFKVTQDASFGNNRSKSIQFNNAVTGELVRTNFPFMISLDKALKLIEKAND